MAVGSGSGKVMNLDGKPLSFSARFVRNQPGDASSGRCLLPAPLLDVASLFHAFLIVYIFRTSLYVFTRPYALTRSAGLSNRAVAGPTH